MEEQDTKWVDYADEEKLLIIDGYLDGVVALDDKNDFVNKQRQEWLREHIPAYKVKDGKNYIFISYSHLDYKEVYKDLAAFSYNPQRRVRFWYDEGLPVGHDWEKVAGNIIKNPHCIGVLFYLSKNLLLSPSVFKEIEYVKEVGKPYFTIALDSESYSARKIFDDLKGSELRSVRECQDKLEDFFPDNNTALISYGKVNVLSRIDKIAEEFDVTEEVFSDFVCKETEGGLELVAYRGKNTIVRIPEKICDKNIVSVTASFPNAVVLYVPKTVTSLPRNDSFDLSVNLEEIIVDKNNPRYYDINGVLCEKDGNVLLRAPACWDWRKQFENFRKEEQADLFKQLLETTENDARDTYQAIMNLISDGAFFDDTYEDNYLAVFEDLFGFLMAYLKNWSEENRIAFGYAVIYRQTDVLYDFFKKLKKCSAFSQINQIGYSAFKNCTNLQYLFLPDNIKGIDHYAFGKSCLKLVFLPEFLTEISGGLFDGCTALQSVLTETDYYHKHSEQTFDKALLYGNIKVIGHGAFWNTAIRDVKFGSELEETWGTEFAECLWLREVYVPGKVRKLDNTFTKCLRLRKVILGEGVERLEKYCFRDCVCLRYVKVPDSVKFIEATCFDGCENLEVIEYGGTIEQWRALESAVNPNAFDDMSKAWQSGGSRVKIVCTDGEINPSDNN